MMCANETIAISTLLQPPIVRTGLVPHTALTGSSGYKAPSTRDIPPVTLTNIPHVESKAFQPYLAQVGSLYDAFQRAKEGGDEGDLFRRNQTKSKADDLESILSHHLERRTSGYRADSSRSRRGSASSTATTPLESPSGRRGSKGRGRAPAVTPLSTIPNVYFEEDFHLENPRTFDIVSERSEVVKPKEANGSANGSATAPGRKALATNAILQEKLSWYMDTVEIHLISSISTASKSFFTALGSLRELHSEAAESIEKVQTLRKDLEKLDKEMALGGLKVVNLRRRRENVRRLADAVAQLQEIVRSISDCEEMAENGEIEKALDELDDVERLLTGEPRIHSTNSPSDNNSGELIDLRSLKALEGAGSDLGEIRFRIGRKFESRFLECLLGDLQRHAAAVPPEVTLQRWGAAFQRSRGGRRAPSIMPSYMTIHEPMRMQLDTELKGLSRARHTMPAATAFKDAVLKEMKNLIRRQLPSSNDDDNVSVMSSSTVGGNRHMTQQEKSSALARNLRSLDPEDADVMFTKIYVGVSESLRRLSVQVKVLLDITSGIGSPTTAGMKSPPRSPNTQSIDGFMTGQGRPPPTINIEDDITELLDMSSLLGQAVDIVQTQITKVLKVRAEQSTHLPLEQFLRYFTLNRLFADECEAISGRSGTSLKTVVDGQIKEFINAFGDQQRHRLIQVMDADRWDAKDFGENENATLAQVLEASTADAPAWSQTTQIWLTAESKAETPAAPSNGTTTNGTAKEKTRPALIDEQKYIIPESALLTLSLIASYSHLIVGIPGKSYEIASSLLELLKIFNSRSSQLILGAGATRSAGLKNITARHLALSSQALSFIIALIPYVREFVRRHCPQNATTTSTLMVEFDKVKRLLQDHQTGIHEKLIDIMCGRATAHVKEMKKIDWDSNAAGAAGKVNTYMETLTKETGTLHKTLTKFFPDPTVKGIMGPVFQSYREQLGQAFGEVGVRTGAGKKRFVYPFLSLSFYFY